MEMRKMVLSLFCLFGMSLATYSQVGINTAAPQANTDLTLGSTNKGFLPNKVALVSATSASPLTGTVAEGTIVYNTTDNATMGSGLYYWTGDHWIRVTTTTAKQQDTKMLTYKESGNTEEITLGYVASGGTSVGTLIPSLSSDFTVDKPGTVFILSVLYAKLNIVSNAGINWAYAGNTFFRVRVTNTLTNEVNDFISGCSPVSTAQPGTNATVAANNNPASALSLGALTVQPNVPYHIDVYGFEGWVTTAQGRVIAGTYLWRTFILRSSIKVDYISDAY